MIFPYINPILLFIAVVPAVFLMIKVYKADRLEREPGRLLLSLVILGILSTTGAVILETIGQNIIGIFDENSLIYSILMYYGVVAFSEEGCKYILLKKRTWKSAAFNCQFDGVIYAVFVGLGFALWENIQYVAIYGFETGLLRAVTAIPGHCSFAVFMGVWYGMAKRYEYAGEPGRSKTCRTKAVLVPAFMHGTYDFLATYSQGWAFIAFAVFVLIMFLRAFYLVRKMSRDDRYIGTQHGRDEQKQYYQTNQPYNPFDPNLSNKNDDDNFPPFVRQ